MALQVGRKEDGEPMRDRRIKAEFWSDEKVAKMEPAARLLYLALMNWCDDKGRGRGNAASVKSFVFVYDDSVGVKEVDRLLGVLESAGRIVRYSVRDEQYLCLPRLLRHQYIVKASRSRLPAPPREALEALELDAFGEPGSGDRLVQELLDDNPWPSAQYKKAQDLEEEQTSMFSSPSPEKRKVHESKKNDLSPSVEYVFQAWCRVMAKTKRAVLSPERRKCIESCLRQGYSEEDLRKAVYGCRVTPYNMGQNDSSSVYDDLTLICRNASNVDRFIGNFERWCSKTGNDPNAVEVSKLVIVSPEAPCSGDLFDRVNKGG